MDSHMQIMEFHSFFQKHGLPYATYGISSSSLKTWTIICSFWILFPFSKNVDYHIQFMKFLSLLNKRLAIICNFRNFFPFFKNVDYHMQILKFLSLLQKLGLPYATLKISLPSPKTWTIICNF